MKKILFALILAMQGLFGAQALAAPCTMSSLATYVGLGSAGCEIGSFRFSNFALLGQITNSLPFSTLNVTPIMVGTTAIGLDFTVNASAGPNVFFDNLISYRVTGLGATVNGASLSINGSSTTGDGTVTAVEDLCLGGLFTDPNGVSGCNGSAQNLIVINFFGTADPPASLAFLPIGALAVVTDIGVDGGGDGTASLVSASNRFQIAALAVPEPGSLLLIAAGLLALYGYRGARRLLPASRRA